MFHFDTVVLPPLPKDIPEVHDSVVRYGPNSILLTSIKQSSGDGPRISFVRLPCGQDQEPSPIDVGTASNATAVLKDERSGMVASCIGYP